MKYSTSVLICSIMSTVGAKSLAAQAVGQIPATNQNILVDTKQSESGEGDVIYVDNRSTQNIIVTSIKFSDCENIKPGCGIVTVKVRVKAGDKRMVYRVLPRNPDQGFTYRSSISWKPEEEASPPSSPSPARESGPPTTAMVPFSVASKLIEPGEFRPAVAASDSGGSCQRLDDPGLDPKGSAFLMSFGPASDPTRVIMVQLDSAGHVLHYSDIRGAIALPEGAQPGSAPAGLRTTIAINLVLGMASVSNEGGNRPAEHYSMRGPAMLTAVNLGSPGKMLQRMQQECAGRD